MAVLVEQRYGRLVFDQCPLDPDQLLVRYNAVAKDANAEGASLPVWSPKLLAELQAPQVLDQ